MHDVMIDATVAMITMMIFNQVVALFRSLIQSKMFNKTFFVFKFPYLGNEVKLTVMQIFHMHMSFNMDNKNTSD